MRRSPAGDRIRSPPTVPIMFLKPPNTVVGPNDDVAIPRANTKTDWEIELGAVISRRASYLDSPADSIGHIAGFVVANDLSEREFQLELSVGQWSKGKSAPGFNPTSPWLVIPDEVDHRALRLRSWVNGESRSLAGFRTCARETCASSRSTDSAANASSSCNRTARACAMRRLC